MDITWIYQTTEDGRTMWVIAPPVLSIGLILLIISTAAITYFILDRRTTQLVAQARRNEYRRIIHSRSNFHTFLLLAEATRLWVDTLEQEKFSRLEDVELQLYWIESGPTAEAPTRPHCFERYALPGFPTIYFELEVRPSATAWMVVDGSRVHEFDMTQQMTPEEERVAINLMKAYFWPKAKRAVALGD